MMRSLLFATTTAIAAVAASPTASTQCPSQAITMAQSIMSRSQGIMTGLGGSSEALQAGFVQKALSAIVAQYPDDTRTADIKAYVLRSADSATEFLSNATKDALSYPMDRLSNGNAQVKLFAETEEDKYGVAMEALRTSIDLNRRNELDGLWYFVYPNWSYLDGMYSLVPFLTLYTATNDPTNKTAIDDLSHQIQLLWDSCYNATYDGLLVHGYDASHTAVWVNGPTGQSPHVWGRSLGWFMMTLVDTLDILGSVERGSKCQFAALHTQLQSMLTQLSGSVMRAVDETTGAWWQILDEPGREGNYIESSGSAMFSYALMKGARLGLLSNASNVPWSIGERAYGYINETFVVRHENGTADYDKTVSVCSLNSTATYDYYVNQPIQYNSVLGSAAYILASLESERVLAC